MAAYLRASYVSCSSPPTEVLLNSSSGVSKALQGPLWVLASQWIDKGQRHLPINLHHSSSRSLTACAGLSRLRVSRGSLLLSHAGRHLLIFTPAFLRTLTLLEPSGSSTLQVWSVYDL